MRAAAESLAERLLMPGSPFELIPSPFPGAARVFRHAPASLNGVYQKCAGSASHPCMLHGGRHVTYGEILGEARALGDSLRRHHGIRAADRVAIILPTSPQWLTAFVAITSIGAVAVLLEPRITPSRILAGLEVAGCSLAVVDVETDRMLADCNDHRPRLLARNCAGREPTSTESSNFERVECTDGPLAFGTQAIDPEQEALIAFTTGSTSLPKGVVWTHRAVITGMMNMMLGSALASVRNKRTGGTTPRTQSPPSSLLLAPLTHVNGYSHLLLMMQVGGKVVPLRSWDASTAADLIAKHQIRSLNGANAAQLRELLRIDRSQADINSLTSIGIHGEALRENILREMRSRLPDVAPATGYGLTETNGSICAAVGADLMEHPDTCGPVVPAVEIRILAEDDQPVKTGDIGEIQVRGAMLMSGYCGRTQSESAFSRDGWFRTQDQGRMDERGFLYVVQRRQDVFQGDKSTLSLSAIERSVYECEFIEEAAAFIAGAAGRAARVVVAIVPRKGTEDHERRLADRLSNQVPPGECDVVIRTVAQLPRLSSGKVDRRALVQELSIAEPLQGAPL